MYLILFYSMLFDILLSVLNKFTHFVEYFFYAAKVTHYF